MTDVVSSGSLADFLGNHPFFALLTPQLRRWLAGRVRVVHVRAGEMVLREGEEADALYLVTSGRLELLKDTPSGTVSRGTVGQRGSVGEVGVLTGEPHPLSARAVRDSELAIVDRSLVVSLVQESRVFSAALLRFLGEMLSTEEMTATPYTKGPVFCLVPLDDEVRCESLRDELLAQFRQWGTVAVLEGPDATEAFTPEDESAAARRLGELEEQFDHVLIESAPASRGHRWARFCVRQADRDIIVAGRRGPTNDLDIPGLRGCDLVFSDPACDAATRRQWLETLEPRAHYHVGDPTKVAALARRLTGRSVGVVLSGGGARGLAHIGVLRALQESEIPIDRVGGTSMGAFVGAMFASGFPAEEIVQLFHRELVDRKPFNDYTVPVVSLARGKRARGMMDRLFGEKAIEDLPLDFFCITADLVRGEEIVHRRGPVWNLVGASMSIPGWAPPSRIGEQVLVDGGILNNFPVDVMASTGEGPIVGVDAMGMGRKGPASSSAGTSRRPNIGETLAGAVTLGSRRRADENAGRAAVVIRPEVGDAGLLEFTQLDRLYELGRRCALEALEAGGRDLLVPAHAS
ncbi:MAG: hypothetical protein QOC92_909 [Acidimicrobiaceae bacterium]